MRDVKSPRRRSGASPPVTPSTCDPRLHSVGLKDLLEAAAYADQSEPWAFDTEGPLAGEVDKLCAAISNAVPNERDRPLSEVMAADLIYVLAFLRTSVCLRLLFALRASLPGISEQLLTRVMQPNYQSSHELLLLNRLFYVIRQAAAAQIFSPDRCAEVLAAVVAARF